MALDRGQKPTPDSAHTLAWLDEQRRLDHERLIQLARFAEQLHDQVRDQSAAIALLEPLLRARPAPETRPEEVAVQRLIEQAARIDRTLSDHVDAQTRVSQSEGAQLERDRRQLSDLSQQVDGLNRTIEAANGRILALAEEVRHQRDARPPVIQALEELQRAQTTVLSRLSVLDQAAKRLTNTVALAEQQVDRHGSDLGRVDNQVKLLDLRMTREISAIATATTAMQANVDEQLRPIDGLAKQLIGIMDTQDAFVARLTAVAQSIDRVAGDVARLEAQMKTDRSRIDRVADGLEGQVRRAEASGAVVWQLGERINAVVADIDQVRLETKAITQHGDIVVSRVERIEEAIGRLDQFLAEVANDLRSSRREATDRSDTLSSRLEVEVATMKEQAEARYRLAVDHVRRTAIELIQQLRELEAGVQSSAT